MKFTIELDKDQAQRLIDAMTDTYEDLANKIKHLKGRVRNVENMNKLIIKALEDSRISLEQPEPRAP